MPTYAGRERETKNEKEVIDRKNSPSKSHLILKGKNTFEHLSETTDSSRDNKIAELLSDNMTTE